MTAILVIDCDASWLQNIASSNKLTQHFFIVVWSTGET